MSSAAVPLICFAQIKLPEVFNFKIKISAPPAVVRLYVPGPGSKSFVPENEPVT